MRVLPGVKATGEWGYSFNNINPVGVEREQEVMPGVLQEPHLLNFYTRCSSFLF